MRRPRRPLARATARPRRPRSRRSPSGNRTPFRRFSQASGRRADKCGGIVSPGPEVVLADRNLLVIVPALNEEATVGAVVARAREVLDCDVVVIDDGSSDDTASVARASGASVMSHPFNLGVGAALRTGFRLAVDQGYTACVQLDGDGQHDAEEAQVLL